MTGCGLQTRHMGIRITSGGPGGDPGATDIRQSAGEGGRVAADTLPCRAWSAGRFSQAGVVECDPGGLGVSRQEGGWFVAPARAAGCARQVGRLGFCVHREVPKPTKCSRRPRFVGWRPKTGRKPTKWRYPSRFVGWRPKPRPNRRCASASRGSSDSSGRPWVGCCRPWAVTAPSPLLFLLEARPCAAGTVATRGSADLAAERDRAGPGGGTRPSETERPNETWTAPMRRFRLDARSAKGVIWLYVCTRALRVLCEPPFEERVIWPSASCHSLRMWRS